ncbi:unnamed protein product [Spirodela intermedia]|uniref:Starch synthase catalytic domain-containing protein n=1 Tax=Spirodela intermedia TaxID=51605 RepID=A0A7I8J674_SPIIN|nr:unnamed protein product [Spirodela intermedia]CAA6665748.1 unnamed protein product [Spirodela intermedia]
MRRSSSQQFSRSESAGSGPRRRRTGSGRDVMFPLSVNRWRDDLSLTWCTAQRRNEASYALEDKEDPETVEAEELTHFNFVAGRIELPSVGSTEVTMSEDEYEDVIEEDQAQIGIRLNIVFVTAEAAPYSKTGGLGDVCGSLPIALADRGHRVMVVSPRYLHGVSDVNIARAADVGSKIKISCFGGEHEVAFFQEYRAGVDWVFVDHPSYRRAGNPYGDKYGAYGDNQLRLYYPWGVTYGEKCLFLVNDWHAALVPVLLSAKYRPYGVYKDARSILAIHNLAHQGVEPDTTFPNLGLPSEWYGALEWVYPTWSRHMLLTQGYAWEITTPEGGNGLDELLRTESGGSILYITDWIAQPGITNGIDVDDWDPASDKHIPFHYSVADLSGKVKCKMALQKELGLSIRPDCPLIGFIGRLDMQKGTDLIMSAMPDLLQDDIQFVMLGSGDPGTEKWMKASESAHRDKFRGWVGFNVSVSHRITAGCDILLMPSRFEPCGLNQLYAMRYGTVPVVHCTGDTVENFNPYADEGRGEGTGWTFSPLSKDSMLRAVKVATRTYRDHSVSWEGIMKRGMAKDLTWDSAAAQYEQVAQWALVDPPYAR